MTTDLPRATEPTPALVAAAQQAGIRPEALLARRDQHLASRGKRCPACGQRRPVTEWGRDRAQPDGLASRCRSCRRVSV